MDIFEAIQRRKKTLSLKIVKKDRNINSARSDKGSSPIMVAAFFGMADAVRALLDRGGDADYVRPDGFTAVHFAAQEGHASVLSMLIDAGAKVDRKTNVGAKPTPLYLAQLRSHVRCLEILIEAGADPNQRCQHNCPPIIERAMHGDLKRVRLLLDRGAKVDNAGPSGTTALMTAAQFGHEKVVSCLLDRRADPRKKDTSGKSALAFASESGHAAIVQQLLARGADPKEVKRDKLPEGARLLTYEETRAWLKKKKAFAKLKDWWPASFNGKRALVFEGDQHFRSIRLDYGCPLDGKGSPKLGVGVIVNGNLNVDRTIENGEMDFGPFLVVLGDLDVANVAVAGANLFIDGDLKVRGAFHGYYNHGVTKVAGTLDAAILIADDYSVHVGKAARGKIIASQGYFKGKRPPEPKIQDVLLPKYFKYDKEEESVAFKSESIYKALAKGLRIAR